MLATLPDVTSDHANAADAHAAHPSALPLLSRNPILALNDSKRASWRFGRDEKRILLYEWDNDTLAVTGVFRLHPASAILLALLQGSRYRDAVARGAQLFRQPVERMERWYEQQLAHWIQHEVFVEAAEGAPVAPIDCTELAMPADGVDVAQWWLYRPLNLIAKITDACQRACRYCSVHRIAKAPQAETERWLSALDDAVNNGVISITYVGGDPLLHKGLPQMIRFAVDRGIPPFVSTKIFVTERMAATLAEAGLKKLQISIDSDVEDVEDYLLDSPGATKQLLASIENCRRQGLEVRTNSVITPYNVRGFPAMVRRLQDMGVARIGTSACGYSLFADEIDQLLLHEEDGRWLEEQVDALKREGIPVTFSFASAEERRKNFAKRTFCTAGAWGLIVHADGSVVTCDDLPAVDPFVVGNIFETPMMDIWRGDAIQAIRQPDRAWFETTACADCDDFAQCTLSPRICFRDCYHAYGRIWGPSPYCPRAPEAPTRIYH